MANIQNLDISEIASINHNKYIKWVLTHPRTTRDDKKKIVRHLLRIGEYGTEADNLSLIPYSKKRWAVDTVFFKTTYWRAPTENEKDDFWWLRKTIYDDKMRFFYFTLRRSPLPFHLLRESEYSRAEDSIRDLHLENVLYQVLNGQLTQDFSTLGMLAGLLDYLKELSERSDFTDADIANSNRTTEETIKDQMNVTWSDWKMSFQSGVFNVNTTPLGKDDNRVTLDTLCKEYAKEKVLNFYGQYIDKESMQWVDRKKGSRTIAAALTKKINDRGYFKPGTSDDAMWHLLEHQFGFKMSISIFQKAKHSEQNLPEITSYSHLT